MLPASTTVRTGCIVKIPWVVTDVHVRKDTILVWDTKRNVKVTRNACMQDQEFIEAFGKIECLIIIIDIDECMSSPCHANATCTNTLGTYTCECDPEYVGNGFICQLQLEGNIISLYMH